MRLFVFRMAAPVGTRTSEEMTESLVAQGLPCSAWADPEAPGRLNIDVRLAASSFREALSVAEKRIRLLCGSVAGPTTVAMDVAELEEDDFLPTSIVD